MAEDNKAKTEANPAPQTGPAKPAAENIDELKGVSAVGYLGILFLVPLLMHPKSTFAVFHANQGLLLLITAVAVNLIGTVMFLLAWLIIPIGMLGCLILLILGISNALGGKMKRLPLIGNFDILKPQS